MAWGFDTNFIIGGKSQDSFGFGAKTSFIKTPSQIFGANYYDDWDFNESSSLGLTGSLIDSVASLSGSGRDYVSTGGARPTLALDGTLNKNVAQFDGAATFMTIAASQSLYNFLHYGQGCSIVIYKTNVNVQGEVMSNLTGNSSSIGINIGYNSSINYYNYIFRGVFSTYLESSIINTYNQYVSFISLNDTENSTVTEKIYNITNGVTSKNNTQNFTGANSNSSTLLTIGRLGSGVRYLNGNISRIIVINSLPTSTQLSQLQAYLTSYYGTFPIS